MKRMSKQIVKALKRIELYSSVSKCKDSIIITTREINVKEIGKTINIMFEVNKHGYIAHGILNGFTVQKQNFYLVSALCMNINSMHIFPFLVINSGDVSYIDCQLYCNKFRLIKYISNKEIEITASAIMNHYRKYGKKLIDTSTNKTPV